MKNHNYSRKIQKNILSYSILGVLGICLIISSFNIFTIYNLLKKNCEENMIVIVENQSVLIEQFLLRAKDIASQIASRTHLREKLDLYDQGKISLETLVAFNKPVLEDAINQSQEVAGIIRLDRQDRVVLQVCKSIPEKVCHIIGKKNIQYDISGPYTLAGQAFVILKTSIISKGSQRIGTDLVIFSLSSLRRIITTEPVLGEAGKIALGYVQNHQVKFFFPIKDLNGDLVTQVSPDSIIGKAISQALLGKMGIISPPQESSLREILAYGPVHGTSWGIVVRTDHHKVYADVYPQIIFQVLAIITLLTCGALGMIYLLRPLTGKIVIHSEELQKEIQDKTSALQNELHERQQAEFALKASERKLQFLTLQLMHAQENERHRISRELHDELGQALTAIKITMTSIHKHLDKDQQVISNDCEHAIANIDAVIGNVQRLCHDLAPQLLAELGLEIALRNMIEELCLREGIDATIIIDEIDDIFSPEDKINIYRLLQEALNNMAKYAKATEFSVMILRESSQVDFFIEDNGYGFNLPEVLNRPVLEKGMGLITMTERARILGGNLIIDTAPEQGTRLTLAIPITKG